MKAEFAEDSRRILRVPLEAGLEDRAIAVAERFALRGADSVHLASALQLRDELGSTTAGFTFVTSDRKLKAAAEKAGLAVLDPQEQA